LLDASGFDPTAAVPTAEVARVLSNALLNRLAALPVQQAAEELAPKLIGFLANHNGEDTLAVGMMLYPYMQQAGLCSGDISSEEGTNCAFVFGSKRFNMAASSKTKAIPRVSPTSLLGQLLTTALSGPQGSVTADGIYNQHGDGWVDGTMTYTYAGGLVKITGDYGATYQFQIHCTESCRASAAGYGAINGQYLATGSDMVFAAAAAGLYCSFTCSIETGWKALNNKDAIGYALRHGEKRYQPAHGVSYAYEVIAEGCGVLPGVYSLSPAYLALKNTDFDLPYDIGVPIKFGTYAQAIIPTDYEADMEPNPTDTTTKYFPSTTTAQSILGIVGKVAVRSHSYRFNELGTWNFDVIFAAVENTDTLQICNVRVPISAYVPGAVGYADGNQFWVWHGGASSGDYDLPEVNVIIGFNGGHLPF